VPAFLIGAFATFGSAQELKTLSGKNVSGELKRIDGDNIVLQTEAGPVSTPLSQALVLDLRIGRSAPEGKYYDVRLLDDSVLYARDVVWSPKDVQLTLASGTVLRL